LDLNWRTVIVERLHTGTMRIWAGFAGDGTVLRMKGFYYGGRVGYNSRYETRMGKLLAFRVERGLWLFALFSVTPMLLGCAPSETLLRCNYGDRVTDVYAIDERSKRVRLMSVDPPRSGSLQVTESTYNLLFEEDPAGASRLAVEISRFTSAASRELGRKGETLNVEGTPVTIDPLFNVGKCERIQSKDLL
jgi:hypothetical protein